MLISLFSGVMYHMKLYLSSFRLGNNPERLVNLLSDNKKAAVVVNAIDDATEEIRKEKLEQELVDLHTLDITGEELDLRDYFGKKEELNKKFLNMGWCGFEEGIPLSSDEHTHIVALMKF